MYYLSDDPWPPVAVLGAAALGFFVALRVTQDGKYLVRAGIALGLAALVLVVEQSWVTDNERIEAVVYDLARALRASDAEAVVGLMATDAEVVEQDEGLGTIDAGMIRQEIKNVEIQLLNISHLAAEAGQQTRRGKATFRAYLLGIYGGRGVRTGFKDDTAWDLGFKEAAPGVWKITRITPTRLDPRAEFVLRGAMRRSAR